MEAGLVEMLFSFGVVLAIAIFELWRVRPSQDPDRRREQDNKAQEEKRSE